MKPCSRVGLDVTRRCNWKCQMCFYRYSDQFNAAYDKPLGDLLQEIGHAQSHGCDHAVLVGWGEPMLYPDLKELLVACNERKMAMSMITNGAIAVKRYMNLYEDGLDHLHVSVHGEGATLDEVSGVNGSYDKQIALLRELSKADLPWRSNTTIQQCNYEQLPEIAAMCCRLGVKHWVSLGFLPHYEWYQHLSEVAVHPAELRPYIEAAAEVCLKTDVMFTIRYHPMCHLSPKYWPYVVNARYVVYDPWEWCYNDKWPDANDDEMWKNAINIGNVVAIEGEPCRSCQMFMHCGGWNKTYAAGFDGAGLRAITSEEVKAIGVGTGERFTAGFFHDQNPANQCSGTFGR